MVEHKPCRIQEVLDNEARTTAVQCARRADAPLRYTCCAVLTVLGQAGVCARAHQACGACAGVTSPMGHALARGGPKAWLASLAFGAGGPARADRVIPPTS